MKQKITFFQKNKEREQPTLLTSIKTNNVFEFCINIPDGLGDAKHALDIFSLLSKFYENSQTKSKLILVIDKDKIKSVPYLVDDSLQKDVAICNIGGKISDQEFSHRIIILSGWEKTDFSKLPTLVIESINSNANLANYISQSNFFINVSSSLKKELLSILNPKCFVCSIGEYGPMFGYGGEDPFLLPPVISTQMGMRHEDVGLKFDEKIWDMANGINNLDDAARVLVTIQSKTLLETLIGPTDGLSNVEKLEKTKTYLMTHHLVVGYATDSSVNGLISVSTPTSQQYKYVDVVMPIKFVQTRAIKPLLIEQGYQSLVLLSSQGDILEEHEFRENDQGPTFRVIDYQGLDEIDLKILASVANLLMGSGDNSFSMTLSNPNALFFFFLADWKNGLYEVIWNKIQNLSANAPSKYSHLKEYFEKMLNISAAYAPKSGVYFGMSSFPTYKDINPNLFKDIRTYLLNNRDDILYEWKHFVTYLHNNKNFQDYLTNLLYSAELHQYLHERQKQDLPLNEDLIKTILYQNDPAIICNLIYSAIILSDLELIKFICNRFEFLPSLQQKHSLTTIALAHGKHDIAEILMEKDLDLLFKRSTKIASLIGDFTNVTLSFFNQKHIDFLSYFHKVPKIPKHYYDEEGTDQKAIERYYSEKNYTWLNDRFSEKRLEHVYAIPNVRFKSVAVLVEFMPDIFLLNLSDLEQVWCCYKGKYLIIENKSDGLSYGPMLPERQEVLEKLLNEYRANLLQTSNKGPKL